MTRDEYIFWAYDPDPIFLTGKKLWRCSITPEHVSIGAKKPIIIPMRDITDCKRSPYSRGLSSVWIVTGTPHGDIVLTPINPLRPKGLFSQFGEAHAMISVINALRAGESPDLDPNPYLRELARLGKTPPPGITLDPDISPWDYWEVFRPPPPTVRQIIGNSALFIVSVLVALLVLAALFGGIRVDLAH